jgi:hypothetical protein
MAFHSTLRPIFLDRPPGFFLAAAAFLTEPKAAVGAALLPVLVLAALLVLLALVLHIWR